MHPRQCLLIEIRYICRRCNKSDLTINSILQFRVEQAKDFASSQSTEILRWKTLPIPWFKPLTFRRASPWLGWPPPYGSWPPSVSKDGPLLVASTLGDLLRPLWPHIWPPANFPLASTPRKSRHAQLCSQRHATGAALSVSKSLELAVADTPLSIQCPIHIQLAVLHLWWSGGEQKMSFL